MSPPGKAAANATHRQPFCTKKPCSLFMPLSRPLRPCLARTGPYWLACTCTLLLSQPSPHCWKWVSDRVSTILAWAKDTEKSPGPLSNLFLFDSLSKYVSRVLLCRTDAYCWLFWRANHSCMLMGSTAFLYHQLSLGLNSGTQEAPRPAELWACGSPCLEGRASVFSGALTPASHPTPSQLTPHKATSVVTHTQVFHFAIFRTHLPRMTTPQ